MAEYLVIFVVLTKQMTFVITPYDLDRCPTYQEARGNMVQFYQEHDVAGWTYQCFDKPKSI